MTDISATYKRLQQLRKSENLKLKPNARLNPEYSLRYYQSVGVAHFVAVKRLILGDDTGIGKTLTTLAAYCYLLEKYPDYKLMIVCPSSVLYQWESEMYKFCNGLDAQIIESKIIKNINGVKLKSKDYLKSYDAREYQFNQFLKNKNNLIIFNYNTLSSDFHVIKDLMAQHQFMVVYDEATAFKSNKSIAWKYAKEVSKLADRTYALSATIIKNDLLECFSVFQVIMPGIFGNESQFKKNFCIIKRKQLWKGKGERGKVVGEIVGYKNKDFFRKQIDPYYLGRKKKDVASELPSIVSQSIKIKMSPKQQSLYNDALDGFIDFDKFNFEKISSLIKEEKDFEFESKETKIIDKLTALIYCQQICNSPYTIGVAAPSAKEEELLRILEHELFKEKVVIYTRFKKMANRLDDLITSILKMKVLKITGDIKTKDREAAKNTFNTSDDHNIMIINNAAKEGINLQSSGYLVFYDLPFSYGDFLQIIGRIHRIGSKHEKIFLMYLMCTDSVDEKVYEILTKKKELFDEILGDSAVGAMPDINKEIINTLFEEMRQTAKIA